MAVFVHLFDAKNKNSILRNGIRPGKISNRRIKGVYATPQSANYELTHQWMRELKRFDRRVTQAVRFRISDSETVHIGKYNEPHILVAASKAIEIFMNHSDGLGLEIIIPRVIKQKEIISIYQPPKTVGWRYYPNAHGNKPCGCEYCQLGQPYSRTIKQRYKMTDP